MKEIPMEHEEPMLRTLDRWWFGYGSPTSLGLFRILIGTITFLNLIMLAPDWGAWFGENGFMPAWLGLSTFAPSQATGLGFDVPRLCLVSGVTDPRLGVAFFALTVLASVLTAIGLFTRVSAFVLALCLVSLHHRDSSILHGGDTIMRIAVIYLAVSPCGRACSLDRLFRLRRGEEDGPVEVPLYGQRLVQFNLALVYFTTVWAKWFGTKWVNGTATWYPARLPEFYRFPVPGFLNDMPMVYVTTYGTILVEFSLATLVFFRPLRRYVLLAGVLLHGFIEYSMNIPLFSFLMISGYVCHYEGEEVAAFCRRLGDRLRPLMGLEVTLPPGRRLSPAGERFLHAVDPFGFVRYLASEPLSPPGVSAEGGDERTVPRESPGVASQVERGRVEGKRDAVAPQVNGGEGRRREEPAGAASGPERSVGKGKKPSSMKGPRVARVDGAEQPLSPEGATSPSEGRSPGIAPAVDPAALKGRPFPQPGPTVHATPEGSSEEGRVSQTPGTTANSTDPGGVALWHAVKDNGKPAHPFRGVAYRAPGAWLLLLVPTLWRRLMLGCAEAA